MRNAILGNDLKRTKSSDLLFAFNLHVVTPEEVRLEIFLAYQIINLMDNTGVRRKY